MGRRAYLMGQKAAGRRLAAVWPARYPVELLWAHGICAGEVWDPPGEVGLTSAHLQSFVCPVVKRGLGFHLSGALVPVDLFLFPHTCDSLQNLSSLVKDLLREEKPCLAWYPPRDSGPQALAYAESQLESLSRALDRATGPMRDGALEEAVAWGMRRDGLLRDLYRLRAEGRLRATAAEFYEAVRSCEYLWPEEALARLEDFLGERRAEQPLKEGVPILLSGVLPAPASLLRWLDGQGIRIAEDDLIACGRRVLREPLESPTDPWAALARRQLAWPPCSTAGSPLPERIAFLRRLVERSGARGVVFLTMKFCEPEGFERPALVEALRAEGVPLLQVESELEPEPPASLVTRIQAFLESIP
ncbi:MAG: 2-hydroxyacyl-CoA dehydratase subunit D [Acidobacteriota bacterium]